MTLSKRAAREIRKGILGAYWVHRGYGIEMHGPSALTYRAYVRTANREIAKANPYDQEATE